MEKLLEDGLPMDAAKINAIAMAWDSDDSDRDSTGSETLYPKHKAARGSTQLQCLAKLNIDDPIKFHRMTGIVCTIGPSSKSVQTLVELIKAGMTVAKVNLKHLTPEYHSESIRFVREAAEKAQKDIAIIVDTKGNCLRIGTLKPEYNNELPLVSGHNITISADRKYKTECDKNMLWVNQPKALASVHVGTTIYAGDNLIPLICVEKDGSGLSLKCKIDGSGVIGSEDAIILPRGEADSFLGTQTMQEDMEFVANNEVDAVCVSVTTGAEMSQITQLLGGKAKCVKVFAKIDNISALNNIDDVIRCVDGIVIDRVELGICLSIEKTFSAQKKIISKCMRAGKPVLCGTQMLTSMIVNPRPTRAEANDAANAVLDGADMLLLTMETSNGKYPIEAVDILHRVAKNAEAAICHTQQTRDLQALTSFPTSESQGIALAAVDASVNTHSAAIIVMTTTGKSAQAIAAYRPRCPVIAVTRSICTARQLQFHRGIVSVYYKENREADWWQDMDLRINTAIKLGIKQKIIRAGAKVVLATGQASGSGTTNTVRVIRVRDDYTDKEQIQVFGQIDLSLADQGLGQTPRFS